MRAKGPYSEESLTNTWEWLQGRSANSVIDASSSSLSRALDEFPDKDLNDIVPDAPILLLPYLEAWAQTRPEPAFESEIVPFLHGKRNNQVDVHVVWRSDMTHELLARAQFDEVPAFHVEEVLGWTPPVPEESVDVPVWMVRQWLDGTPSKPFLSDVDGIEPDDKQDPPPRQQRLAWRWNPSKSAKEESPSERVLAPADIMPGDTIIVPSSYGGHDAWGATIGMPDMDVSPVRDIGDICSGTTLRSRRIRFTPTLIQTMLPSHDRSVWGEPWQRFLEDVAMDEVPHDGFVDAAAEWIGWLTAHADPEWVPLLSDCARHLITAEPHLYPQVLGEGVLISWTAGVDTEDTVSADDDDSSCLGDLTGLDLPSLTAHQEDVAGWIDVFTQNGLIPHEFTGALRQAGAWHDLGKLDPRFQLMLHGGDAYSAANEAVPLAKSRIDARDHARRKQAQRLARYPIGQRHEELSVRLAQSAPCPLPDPKLLPLVWHLIGSHHGWGRPWFPMNHDPNPVVVRAEYQSQTLQADSTPRLGHLESGWVDQFANLQYRLGFWGLAYLESILRLADYRASFSRGGPSCLSR